MRPGGGAVFHIGFIGKHGMKVKPGTVGPRLAEEKGRPRPDLAVNGKRRSSLKPIPLEASE